MENMGFTKAKIDEEKAKLEKYKEMLAKVLISINEF